MSDVREGGPRAKPKAAFDKGQVNLDVMNAGKVLPFKGKRGGRVAGKDELEKSPEG
jgi:hypothetical protein